MFPSLNLGRTYEETTDQRKAIEKLRGHMHFEAFSFGSIRIDGKTYEHDVVIDRGHIGKRKKKPSKKFRAAFGHIPLSIEEDIPWKCRRLVIDTGTGAMPVMEEVKREAPQNQIGHIADNRRYQCAAGKSRRD